MGVLLKSIRKILVELIDRIDSGECATTDEQERMFLDLCTMIADKERRELLHVTSHISEYYNIPLNTETPCYLLGSLAQASYPVAKHYL